MGSAPETSPQIKIMIVNVKKLLILFEIWGFHGEDYEECRLLGCGAV
jgi:hypothetical protein